MSDATTVEELRREVERAIRQMYVQKAPPHVVAAERAAWQWAKDHALEWSPVMEHIKAIGFSSYTTTSLPYCWR